MIFSILLPGSGPIVTVLNLLIVIAVALAAWAINTRYNPEATMVRIVQLLIFVVLIIVCVSIISPSTVQL